MSENQDRGSIDFAKYDTMTTEALEEILRLDAQTPQGQALDGELLYIMEVLAERKKNNSHTGNTALEAYESFKQNYMPETEQEKPAKVKGSAAHWLRALAATAAVLVLLVAASATASAFGCNLWDAVIQWTQETFHFGNGGHSDPDNGLEFASLQDALEEGNTPAWLVPTKITDGYNLTEIKFEQTPVKKIYKALYASNKKILKIIVWDYLNDDPVYVEKSEDFVEKYETSGITYYLFDNNEQVQAMWIVDSYECYISGHVTIEELKQMINSIEKG